MVLLDNTNMQDVPNEVVPLAPGEYSLEITKVEFDDYEDRRRGVTVPNGKMTLTFRNTEGEQVDKTIRDTILRVKGWELMEVKEKRLLKAAGIYQEDTAIDTDELVGCCVPCIVAEQTYEQDGETRVGAKIRTYIIPSE